MVARIFTVKAIRVTSLAKGLKSLTMTFQPSHTGLFLPPSFLESSRAARESRTLISAWMALDETPVDIFDQILWLAYRWRAHEDTAAGQKALMLLHSLDDATIFNGSTLIEGDGAGDGPRLVGLAHIVEMLRSHPAATLALVSLFHHWFDTAFRETPSTALSFWGVAAKLALGVVLEDQGTFEGGVRFFEDAIADLHPEGYVREAVESKDAQTYARQFSIACALALAAEIGTNAGVNLWAYNNRGVSAKTASAYVLYYLYYPEKWRWSEAGALTLEMTTPLMKHQAAYMEIVHARSPLRSVDILLQQNRPLSCFMAGGMTTLVYGAPPPATERKPWWQFWTR
jgi:hypothetical protein